MSEETKVKSLEEIREELASGLAAIINDDGVDVNKLSTPELREYLEKQGVNVKAGEARFAKFLKGLEGRRRLALAAEKRQEALARPFPVSKIIEQGTIALQDTLEGARAQTCGNAIFETSHRVELNGAITRVKFNDQGQKQLSILANSGAFCNIHCLNTYISRL